jgi:hypothetical protein
MEEDCGGGQGLSWAVEPRGGGEREKTWCMFTFRYHDAEHDQNIKAANKHFETWQSSNIWKG